MSADEVEDPVSHEQLSIVLRFVDSSTNTIGTEFVEAPGVPGLVAKQRHRANAKRGALIIF